MVGTWGGGAVMGETSRPGVPLNKSRGGGTSGSFGGPGVRVGEVAGGVLVAEGSQGVDGVGSWIDFRLETIHPNPGPVASREKPNGKSRRADDKNMSKNEGRNK